MAGEKPSGTADGRCGPADGCRASRHEPTDSFPDLARLLTGSPMKHPRRQRPWLIAVTDVGLSGGDSDAWETPHPPSRCSRHCVRWTSRFLTVISNGTTAPPDPAPRTCPLRVRLLLPARARWP